MLCSEAALNCGAVQFSLCLNVYKVCWYVTVSFSGIVMAVTAGLLFGLNFTPVIYIQQHHQLYPTASNNGKINIPLTRSRYTGRLYQQLAVAVFLLLASYIPNIAKEEYMRSV